MHWYAIHTKPRQELLAQTGLQREGLETFYPRLRRRRTIRRVRRWVTGPLFPCYIFARFDVASAGRLVKYANGVANIVSFGGKPAAVETDILETIRTHCQLSTANHRLRVGTPTSDVGGGQLDIVTIEPPSFKSGDRVEIQEGPFRGLQGIFEREMSDSERIVILLETIARGVRVQVSREQVEKLA